MIEVSTEILGPIGVVRFARPPLNYASPELLSAIADALDALDADATVRCGVLAAEGKAFCAGADLAGDAAMAAGDGMATIGRLYLQAERLFRRRKPLVAAIHGAAIGAGLGLALTADFRVAGPRARFSSNFARLGFHPGFALTYTLPRLVGERMASWMHMSAVRMKPEEALACGLADRLADEGQELAAAMDMARTLAENAPLSLVAIRQTLNRDFAENVAAAMRREHAAQTKLMPTADYAEGVASVFERRDAQFLGR